MKPGQPFTNLPALAEYLRGEWENKKTVLLYPFNPELFTAAAEKVSP